MLPEAVDRLLALPDDATVLDVGGWAAPLNRADWVIDAMPFASRGAMGFSYGGDRERFGEDTWVVRDVCDPEPWPFPDGAFDVATCVTTLEDLRDPVRVCREMARVAREAYLEVPTVIAELLWGAEGPWLGHVHHHWFCEVGGPADDVPRAERLGGEPAARTRPTIARVRFAMKQHSIHGDPRLRVTPSMAIELAPREHLQGLWWSGAIDAAERLLVGTSLHDELAATVTARFPAGRLERGLRRAERAALGRGRQVQRPARDRVGAGLRRLRGGGVPPWDLGLRGHHVRGGLGVPRDGG